MNREIKFRAWCPENNEMYYAGPYYSFRVYSTGVVAYHPEYLSEDLESYCTVASEGEKEIVVMQFTGLKDKNGKEIYEGDILKVYDKDDWEKDFESIYPVIWGNDYPAFTLAGYEDLEYNSLQHATLVLSCEIIGNIYETEIKTNQ